MRIKGIIDIINEKVSKGSIANRRELESLKVFLEVEEFSVESTLFKINTEILYENALVEYMNKQINCICVDFPLTDIKYDSIFERVIFIDKEYNFKDEGYFFIYCNEDDILFRKKVGLYQPGKLVKVKESELVYFLKAREKIKSEFREFEDFIFDNNSKESYHLQKKRNRKSRKL